MALYEYPESVPIALLDLRNDLTVAPLHPSFRLGAAGAVSLLWRNNCTNLGFRLLREPADHSSFAAKVRASIIMISLRHILRRLRQAPLFTVITVLTLALGIGANIGIFSIVDGVLLKPLPYPESEHLVALWMKAPGVKIDDLNMAPYLYFTFRDEARAFDHITIWNGGTTSLTGVAEPEEVPALYASHQLLPALGTRPALGRGFTAADDDPKGVRTVMLSDGYWKSKFGGAPNILGRRLILDGDAHEVIGVLPPDFQFMDRRISLLIPYRLNRSEVHLGNFSHQGLARLKPGKTIADANADMARMLPLGADRFPPPPGYSRKIFDDAGLGPNIRSLKAELLGDISSTLWVLMGTVGLVLLIACANVANLLLVRAEGRQQEFAIRAALGAGWGAIARELFLESVLLGAAGGVAGLALANGGIQALIASELPNLPRIRNIKIDATVIAFAFAISMLASVLFGMIPVLKYVRPQLASALRGGGRSASQSRERHRARGGLVVVQVALAVVLLVSSGLMIRTFAALRRVDPGFSSAERIQTLRISIPSVQVKEHDAVMRMEEAILRKIEALPQVESVAMTQSLPMSGSWNDPVYVQDQPPAEGKIPTIRRFKYISPEYVKALGSRLVAGRAFTWSDTYQMLPLAMVSENMARELWKSPEAAIGKRIRITPKDDWREVIGVVADLRDNGIDQKAPTIVYWPLRAKNFSADASWVTRGVSFIVRSPRAGSARLQEELRQAVWSINPSLPLANVQTLQTIYDRSLARTTFTMLMLAIAGAMALLLGLVGIYGVISYSVAQRRREIGIRLALGSPAERLTGLFIRDGMVLSGIGAIVGVAAAVALSRALQSLLFEITPTDPLTYVAVAAVLLGCALLASYLPARRATRVDPIEALRSE